MTKKNLPPLEVLKSEFSYDPSTGIFKRLRKNTTWTNEGEIAGYTCNTHGYRFLHVKDYGYFRAHLIAWKMHYGSDPDYEIDHINRNRSDNRIENLRSVSHLENCRNKSDYSNNKSGYRGVSWKKSSGRWVAQITHEGERIYIGLFNDPHQAHLAYVKKRDELLGV